ncbi:lipid-A-disaccharide synthase [Rhodobacteraceae bacterium]|nr:lipid-A-disaccharide synthase [Paracoccaceae bacterium]
MKLYLLAGEPSGDKLGGALLTALKTLHPEIDVKGVAGPEMQAAGMDSLFPMDDLSVMGLTEVLPKYPELKRRLNEATADCIAWQPDALITIDVPDFSLRLAKVVREKNPGIKTIHYVAPSVWAWRAGRAEKMARYIDHVLALLPFEPPFMQRAGMTCDFTGHPVVAAPRASDADAQAFRHAEGLQDAPIILVLPGSRRNEVARLAPIFGEAMRATSAQHPIAKIVVPASAPVASAVLEATASWPGHVLVLDPRDDPNAEARKRAAFQAADVALAASGTVSLELAANATPMVIAYDMSWLSWQIVSRMVKLDTVTLVNLITETKTIPEFLGPACKPEAIARALNDLLSNPSAQAAQKEAMIDAMRALGEGGERPGLRAARSVLKALSSQ